MAFSGLYLESQIRGYLMEPFVAFNEYIFSDVIPSFGNLDERANKVAEDYYNRIGSQPVGEDCDIDMGAVAEDAQDQGVNWYQMMTSLQQTMLNLLAAGLYHLVEQQLAALSGDVSFSDRPLKETKLRIVRAWFLEQLKLDFGTLPSWSKIDELRHVANVVKHGEGAAGHLRKARPNLFKNPVFDAYDKALGLRSRHMKPAAAPLSGEDFFVTEDLLKEYAQRAESFFNEIADHFKASAEYY